MSRTDSLDTGCLWIDDTHDLDRKGLVRSSFPASPLVVCVLSDSKAIRIREVQNVDKLVSGLSGTVTAVRARWKEALQHAPLKDKPITHGYRRRSHITNFER